MKKHSLGHRLRYAFDNTLSRHPFALIGWLALFAAAIIILATAVALLFPPKPLPANYTKGGVVWRIVYQALTPNPLEDMYLGSGWHFPLVMFLVTLVSLFIVSGLISVLNATIQHRVAALRRGRTPVIETGHTVILGWSDQVLAIVRELIVANKNQGGRRKPSIIILGDKGKVEMEDEIHQKVKDTGRTRVVCRSGSPIDRHDLEIVSLETAESIIVMTPEDPRPDAQVVKTLWAINEAPNLKAGSYIVAAVRDPRNSQLVRKMTKNAEPVLVNDFVARIIAQACRQPGLSTVYQRLLDFEGDQIIPQIPEKLREEVYGRLVGRTFGDALCAFKDVRPIGLRPRGSQLEENPCPPKLNPGMKSVITKEDELICIAKPSSTFSLTDPIDAGNGEDAIQPYRQVERTLILGWNSRAPAIIAGLDDYVAHGSQVMVVADYPGGEDDPRWHHPSLRNQTYRYQKGDTTDRRILESLQIETYDHAIVLSYSDTLAAQQADAHTLLTRQHLRDIADHCNPALAITSEILDVHIRDLVEVTTTDDFIFSNELASLLLAQVSQKRPLNAVFYELFSPIGSDVQLRPAGDYVQLEVQEVQEVQVEFRAVVEAARRRGEIALGHCQLTPQSENETHKYSVIVNPGKSEKIILSKGDSIIVLARF